MPMLMMNSLRSKPISLNNVFEFQLWLSKLHFPKLLTFIFCLQVVGEVCSVRDALIQIVLRLRDDVLKGNEGVRHPSGGFDSVYCGAAGLPVPSMLPNVPSVAPLTYDQRAETGAGVGMLSSSSLYGYGSFPVSL